MSPVRRPNAPRIRRSLLLVAVAAAGFGTAALAGITSAKTFTLKVAKNASVTNFSTHKTIHENIVVNAKSHALYALSGETKAKPKCTKANGCFRFWVPATVASARSLSKAPGVPGKLGTWRRNGFLQVTLAGHPLYTYIGDPKTNSANGEGVVSFGGTWHVRKATTTGSTGTTTKTTTPTTTPHCAYPPYC